MFQPAIRWQFLILWLSKHRVVGGCDISFGDKDGSNGCAISLWQSFCNFRSVAVWGAASSPLVSARMELLFGCQLWLALVCIKVKYGTWIWSWHLSVRIIIVGVLKINRWQKIAFLSRGFCCLCFWNSRSFAQQKSSSLLNFLFVLLEPSPTKCQCSTCYSDYSGESGPRTLDETRLFQGWKQIYCPLSSVVQGIKRISNAWICFFVALLFQCRKDLTVRNCSRADMTTLS